MLNRYLTLSMLLTIVVSCKSTDPSSKISDANMHSSISYDAFEWTTKKKMTNFSGHVYGSRTYKTVRDHVPANPQCVVSGQATTTAHECTHYINCLNPVNNAPKMSSAPYFFYVHDDQGIMVKDTNIQYRRIKQEVVSRDMNLPQNIKTKAANYAGAFVNIYYFDEWSAYLVGGRVGVEMAIVGTRDSFNRSDLIDEAVNLMWISSATVLALKKLDPAYVDTNMQFRGLYRTYAEKTMELINDFKKLPNSRNYSQFGVRTFENFKSESNAKMIEGLISIFGEQWVKKTFEI